MIIGSGNIARVLTDREGAIFFASGVSNSNCRNPIEFEREKKLLLEQDSKKCLFYFSSIAVFTKDSDYIRHKKSMEVLILKVFQSANIIRIGNLDWDSNPNTFLNYLRDKISRNEEVKILDEYRYMISKEQLLLLTNNLPLTGQNVINAFGYMGKVKDLIKTL